MADFLQSQRDTLQKIGEVKFNIRVHPGARRTYIKDVMADGTLKIDIAAVAEDGRANIALVEFLSEEFGVAKGRVEIVAGKISHSKVVRLRS